MRAIPAISTILLSNVLSFGQGGQVAGKVVDLVGDAIPRASIRLIPADTTVVVAQTVSDGAGAFTVAGLEDGVYSLKLGAPGFRSRTVHGIVVRKGAATSVKALALEVPSCDAPGVYCDSVSADPDDFPPKPLSTGYLRMKAGCEADLISNTVWCSGDTFPDHRARDKDFKIFRDGGHIYLSGLNGAELSQPNSTTADCKNAVFGPAPAQVDGLDRDSDICVRTRQKYISHIFFVDDVTSNSSVINLKQVTRKGIAERK